MDDGIGHPMRPAAILATSIGLTASPGSSSPMQASAPAATFAPSREAVAADAVMNGVCVFSGGTAANSLVDAFDAVAKHLSTDNEAEETRQERRKPPCSLTYIIPISDNGGSSSELIRFFGGPSVGDVRSRLVRLIPSSDDEGNERAALRVLFEHRLCASDPNQARTEWLDLVEARHLLWTFVPSAARELIRAVLNTLNLEIVKRARPSTSVFNFAGASVGNLFLTGARLFSGSFEAGIYLLSLLCGIPDHVAVLPAINSNFTHHISAGLVDGTTIAGQVNISHPSLPTSLPDGGPLTVGATGGGGADGTGEVEVAPEGSEPPLAGGPAGPVLRRNLKARKRASTAVDFEDATLPGSLPVLRQPQITFSKEDEEDLPSRIARIWYINPYGHEIRPQANPKALAALRQAEAIIYSIGSLYTSIVPSLVLRGVGAAISYKSNSSSPPRKKALILNSRLDRETGPRSLALTAVDFVRAIVGACKQSQSDFSPVQDSECRQYVTHLVFLDMAQDGIEGGSSGSAAPEVDEEALGQLGIRCLAVPTQASQEKQAAGEGAAVSSKKAMERYDQTALTQTLKQLLDGSWDRQQNA